MTRLPYQIPPYSYSKKTFHPLPCRPQQTGNRVDDGIEMQRFEYEYEEEYEYDNTSIYPVGE